MKNTNYGNVCLRSLLVNVKIKDNIKSEVIKVCKYFISLENKSTSEYQYLGINVKAHTTEVL